MLKYLYIHRSDDDFVAKRPKMHLDETSGPAVNDYSIKTVEMIAMSAADNLLDETSDEDYNKAWAFRFCCWPIRVNLDGKFSLMAAESSRAPPQQENSSSATNVVDSQSENEESSIEWVLIFNVWCIFP